MMSVLKHRSVFWVVSTYVLTTGTSGFVISFLVAPVIGLLLAALFPSPPRSVPVYSVSSFIGYSVWLTLGYMGGTWYSLRYIRKVALVDRPQACVVPAVATFAVLAALAIPVHGFILALSIGHALQGSEAQRYTIAVGVLHALITVVFAVLTKRGFARMAEHGQEPAPAA